MSEHFRQGPDIGADQYPSKPWKEIRVNFQPADAPVPDGYFPDSGGAYSFRNGHIYGWTTAVTSDILEVLRAEAAVKEAEKALAEAEKKAGIAPSLILRESPISVALGGTKGVLFGNGEANNNPGAVGTPGQGGVDNADESLRRNRTPRNATVLGKIGQLIYGKGEQVQGHYELVPLSELVASSLSDGSANPNYSLKAQNRTEVIARAREIVVHFSPADMIDNRSGPGGTPGIKRDSAEVIHGNARTVALQILSEKDPVLLKRYVDYLRDHSGDYGFTRAQVDGIARTGNVPVLVRSYEVSQEKANDIGPKTNNPESASLTTREIAATILRRTSAKEIFEQIPISTEETLAASIRKNPKCGQWLRLKIEEHGMSKAEHLLFSPSGELTPAGVDLLKQLVYAAALGEGKTAVGLPLCLAADSKSYTLDDRNLDQILHLVFQAQAAVDTGVLDAEWGTLKDLREALQVVIGAPRRTDEKGQKDETRIVYYQRLMQQGDFLGVEPAGAALSPVGKDYLKILVVSPPTMAKEAIASYAKTAAEGASFFNAEGTASAAWNAAMTDVRDWVSKTARLDWKAIDNSYGGGKRFQMPEKPSGSVQAREETRLRDLDEHFPVDAVAPELLDTKRGNAEITQAAADVMKSWPEKVTAADGAEILLHNPQGGLLSARLYHMLRDGRTGAIHKEKAAWLPNVPVSRPRWKWTS